MVMLDLNPFFFTGGPVGCLLIHGGTGSPPEMRPMGEYLAAKGLTVLGVRLAGHGTIPEDLLRTSWQDLVASAEEGLYRLQGSCERVFVAGLSMGGLLALYLAARYPIAGAIVMAAPAYLSDWRLRWLPIIKHFVKWYHSSGEVDLTDPEAGERIFFYRRVPLVFGEQVNRLLQEVRSNLGQVKVPVLIMQGRRDRTIPADSAQILFDSLGSDDKEIVWWPNSGHAITVDSEREAVWARAYDFIAARMANS
ncbi:MAG: alpha/beta fold hydrolase [Chloroflexi bacterium]|nr:alpha/beta fold hydrolase [Chloroflexota bacterium]